MIKPQHTKGKWFWRTDKKGRVTELIADHSGKLVVLEPVRHGMQGAKFWVRDENCLLVDATPDHPDMQLIARAPEMFEALQNIRTLVASKAWLRDDDIGKQILELCKQGGVQGSVLRGEE